MIYRLSTDKTHRWDLKVTGQSCSNIAQAVSWCSLHWRGPHLGRTARFIRTIGYDVDGDKHLVLIENLVSTNLDIHASKVGEKH